MAVRMLYVTVTMGLVCRMNGERAVYGGRRFRGGVCHPRRVWSSGCRGRGCLMLSTSWEEGFGRRRRFAVDAVSRGGIGLRRRGGMVGFESLGSAGSLGGAGL